MRPDRRARRSRPVAPGTPRCARARRGVMPRPPREDVQRRDRARATHAPRRSASRLAVDVHLPVQRRAAARSCRRPPCVGATHGSRSPPCTAPGASRAQRAAAIVDAVCETVRNIDAPHRALNAGADRHDARHQAAPARAARAAPSLRDERERAIRRRDQAPREGDALGLVAVEQRAPARAPQHVAASFHARFTASPMPVFMPWPPTGLWMCAASPSEEGAPAAEVIARRGGARGRSRTSSRARRRCRRRSSSVRADVVPGELVGGRPRRSRTVPMSRARVRRPSAGTPPGSRPRRARRAAPGSSDGPRAVDVGDVEQALVGAAGEADAERARARVERAPSQPARYGDVAASLGSVGAAQPRHDTGRPRSSKSEELGRGARLSTPVASEPLDQQRARARPAGRSATYGNGLRPAPDVAEHGARDAAAARPTG